MLPMSLLQEAQAELLNWQGLGLSILEIGHRTPEFQRLMYEAEHNLRQLLDIPEQYHVLFLSGAARAQFGMIPMNFLSEGDKGAYLVSGVWSSMAYDEACRLKQAYCLASSKISGFKQAPNAQNLNFCDRTAYVYYTPNETVNGVRFPRLPNTGDIPLIADMTSCLLSEPIRVSDYGLIFAGAQKNIAPAGLTLLIIRADLLSKINNAAIPTMMDYRTHVMHQTLYATPPVFNCYMASKMFKWIKAEGGVQALYERNVEKAQRLYDYIDASSFYECLVEKQSRSLVNICFSLKQDTRTEEFILEASRNGLYALKGHRLVGGLRASLYNAMPMQGVEALIAFMKNFAK